MASRQQQRSIRGHIDVHPRGFGFVTVEGAEAEEIPSAFVPPPDLKTFLAGDLVAAVARQDPDGRWTAGKLQLQERTRTRVFGEVVLHRGSPRLRVDREVSNADWSLEAPGVELTSGEAVVALVRGDQLTLEERLPPGADASLERVVTRYGFQKEFGPEVLAEAERVRGQPHAPGARRDLRSLPTVTIDAASTRDMDDAISVLPASADGALRLFVSIADASEAVVEGSPLDQVAKERGTSVYLANRVLPMLPESLSTEWLSLVPGQDRSCLTVELRIDPEGRVTAADVYESLIRSWARLDYNEVADYLEHGVVSERMQPVRDALPWFRAASARLGVARARRGGLRIDRQEARLTFDEETGEVSGIESIRSTPAHTLVERFMVAANEAIATWLADRGVTTLFRVQEQPDMERVAELDAFALHAGFATGFGRELTPLALAAFDRQISGCTAEPALREMLRRSLGPARYTVAPAMHFGLAAPLYTHFTSPIRRYTDLLVHRTIKQYLHGRREFVPADPQLEQVAQHLNDRARLASRAERSQRQMLEARLLANRVGEELPGRVTRVKSFGLFVQLDGTMVEGLVPSESLPDGPYRIDTRETTLVGPKRSYTIGVPVMARINSTDQVLGRVELTLTQTDGGAADVSGS